MEWRTRRLTQLVIRQFGSAIILLAFSASMLIADDVKTPQGKDQPKPVQKKEDEPKKEEPKPAVKLGLSLNDPKALQGYTLLAPLDSSKTYLLDMEGNVVHTWESDCSPALCPLLLENGHLLRPGSIGGDSRVFGPGPGVGGRVQEFTWDGELVWDFKLYNARQLPHHDMTRLPNGHILMIVWDRKTTEETIAAGRRPEMIGDKHFLPDSLIEIKPTGKTTGEVVWEWHLWDHLIQDFDKTKANFGNVGEHQELVNINFGEDEIPAADKDSKDKPTATPKLFRANPDYTHFNGVSYNPDLDQISVSVHAFSEFWIIDHSTTTAEAAGHSGGRSGKGGDLLFRWGNPRAYRAGTKADQKLFSQHNAHWIPRGLPGEGHLLVFNNGAERADGTYSSVDELVLPADAQGRYAYKHGTAYGPEKPVWSYTAPTKSDFHSSYISGAQRLANGNTLVCSGANGTVFEVTPEKEIVWKYINPVKGGAGSGFAPPRKPGQILTVIAGDMPGFSGEQRKQLDEIQKAVDSRLDKTLTSEQKTQLAEASKNPGQYGFGAPARPGQVLLDPEQRRLKLSDEQKKDLTALQKDVDEKLEKAFTEAQRKQIKSVFAPPGPPPGGPPPAIAAGPQQAGQILSLPQQDTLKLTAEQKKQIEIVQKGIDAMLDNLLTEEQRTKLREMRQDAIRIAAPAGPGRGGPAGGSPLFRAYRFPTTYAAFSGKKLTPGKPLE